jgi:hypothetical protein
MVAFLRTNGVETPPSADRQLGAACLDSNIVAFDAGNLDRDHETVIGFVNVDRGTPG